MKRLFAIGRHRQFWQLILTGSLAAACAIASAPLHAQSARPRIQAEINTNQATILKGSQHPMAQSRFDVGRMPSNTELHGITIFFNRSAAQEAALQTLIKAQQNPSSPQYHQWLTPEEFGAQFGMTDADIQKVQNWLESEGFKVDSVNRAKTAIHFSGSAAQVERAFATEMHFYSVNGEKHFAPSTALSVPVALAGVVANVGNLHDFHPKPLHVRGKKAVRAHKQYTFEGSDGNEYVLFAPGDIKIAYDINSLINAGKDGTGQTIAIMGQSAIQTSDIEAFQQAAGLTVKDPTVTLVPNTGSSTLNPGCSNGGSYTCGGDEGESDLDLEWSGATAPGATINFVYTGGTLLSDGTPEFGVFDSYQYAVDNKIGNIISISYGSCETDLPSSDYTELEAVGQEAIAQGQSVLAASGDSGSTACEGYTDLSTTQQEALAVNYPASSAYVTGVGGTEISSDDDQVGTYWSSASSSSNGISLTTALSYIPEIAWNDDDSTYGLSASGGGTSTLTARPSWQTGVTGITSGDYRLVPDVSLYSSPNYPGYLYCTSDEADWSQGGDGNPAQTASCQDSQFYDATNGYFTIAGGTSFASPIFAGMLAIVNQAKGFTSGQGLANVELYQLAANSTTYASAFHDVTSGNNDCTAGSSYCGSQIGGFSAGTGYDEVTGLGSVDLANLVTSYSSLLGTTTTITLPSAAPVVGTASNFSVTVAAASGSDTPTGSVTVKVDGTEVSGSPFTLTNGSASFQITFSTTGSHTITASYSGDSTFGASSGTASVTVSSGTAAVATTTAVTPASTTPAVGANDVITFTITPASGTTAPTGTVSVAIDGTTVAGSVALTASGSKATGTYTATFSTAGSHTIKATYSGDSNFTSSTGSATVTAQASSSGSGTISVAATPTTLTVSQGSTGTENVKVTGGSGYSGTVTLNIDFGSADNDLGNLCYGWGTNGAASGTATISAANGSGSTTLQLDANAADCATADAVAASRTKQLGVHSAPNVLKKKLNKVGSQSKSRSMLPEGVAFAGLLVIGFLGRRSRKLRGLVAVLMLVTVGMAISACGGGGGSDTPSNPPKGTYTGTITAQDSTNSNITNTTTFTFVID